jgi:hypothetical protein
MAEPRGMLRHDTGQARVWLICDAVQHLVLVTLTHLSLFDVRSGKRVEYSQYSMLSRLSWSRISPRSLSLTSRFSAHKGKIFILVSHDMSFMQVERSGTHNLLTCSRPNPIYERGLSCSGRTGSCPYVMLVTFSKPFISQYHITPERQPVTPLGYLPIWKPEDRYCGLEHWP